MGDGLDAVVQKMPEGLGGWRYIEPGPFNFVSSKRLTNSVVANNPHSTPLAISLCFAILRAPADVGGRFVH